MAGQLTATVHGDPSDLINACELISVLETRAGRLIFNQFPTGVEVGDAIVHGGPYPASSDSRTTSVGSRAILRFVHQSATKTFQMRLFRRSCRPIIRYVSDASSTANLNYL